MTKWIIALLALAGGLFLLNAYFPSLWFSGITAWGHTIPYAVLVMVGVLYLVFKGK